MSLIQKEDEDSQDNEKVIDDVNERKEAERLSKLREALEFVVQEVCKNDPDGEKINSLILQHQQWERKARKNQFGYLNVVKEALETILPRDILGLLDEKIIDVIGRDINIIADDICFMISNRCFFVDWYYNFLEIPQKEADIQESVTFH